MKILTLLNFNKLDGVTTQLNRTVIALNKRLNKSVTWDASTLFHFVELLNAACSPVIIKILALYYFMTFFLFILALFRHPSLALFFVSKQDDKQLS